jgi:hypothetical protein
VGERTALQLVQSACYEANIPAPTVLATATGTGDIQLRELFYAVGRDLLKSIWWPQLKKQYVIQLVPGRTKYNLPPDFYSFIPDTDYDRQNNRPLGAPRDDSEWSATQYGYMSGTGFTKYRVFGPENSLVANKISNDPMGALSVYPVPGASAQGTFLVFEYISASWIHPARWEPTTAYTSGSSYVSVGQNIYVSGTTASSGTRAPTVSYGIGQDGGVLWQSLTTAAWASSTLYNAGDYVTNGGLLYVATAPGTSAGSGGPSGSGTGITDNTVTWDNCPLSTWTGFTAYGTGTYILNGGVYYRVVNFGNDQTNDVSGRLAPNWSALTSGTWTQSDGAVTWTQYLRPYNRLASDSDFILFDEDVMILGLQARFMRAKGLEFAAIEAEYETAKNIATGRWKAGERFNLGGRDEYWPWPSVAEGSWRLS